MYRKQKFCKILAYPVLIALLKVVVDGKREDGRTCDEIRKICKLY